MVGDGGSEAEFISRKIGSPGAEIPDPSPGHPPVKRRERKWETGICSHCRAHSGQRFTGLPITHHPAVDLRSAIGWRREASREEFQCQFLRESASGIGPISETKGLR